MRFDCHDEIYHLRLTLLFRQNNVAINISFQEFPGQKFMFWAHTLKWPTVAEDSSDLDDSVRVLIVLAGSKIEDTLCFFVNNVLRDISFPERSGQRFASK